MAWWTDLLSAAIPSVINGVAANNASNRQVSATQSAAAAQTGQLAAANQALATQQQNANNAFTGQQTVAQNNLLTQQQNALGYLGTQQQNAQGFLGSQQTNAQNYLTQQQATATGALLGQQQNANAAVLGQQDMALGLNAGARNMGTGAQNLLGKLYGYDANGNPTGAAPDYSGFYNSPGYQFSVQQGNQAIQRQAAAQGGLYSTNTMAQLSAYNTGQAATHYNDYVSQLMNMAQLGTSAQNTSASGAYQTGQTLSSNAMNTGSALASNAFNTGNAMATNAFNTGSALASNAFNTGDAMATYAQQTGTALANNALATGQGIANTATSFGNTAANNAVQTGQGVSNSLTNQGMADAAGATATGSALQNLAGQLLTPDNIQKLYQQLTSSGMSSQQASDLLQQISADPAATNAPDSSTWFGDSVDRTGTYESLDSGATTYGYDSTIPGAGSIGGASSLLGGSSAAPAGSVSFGAVEPISDAAGALTSAGTGTSVLGSTAGLGGYTGAAGLGAAGLTAAGLEAAGIFAPVATGSILAGAGGLTVGADALAGLGAASAAGGSAAGLGAAGGAAAGAGMSALAATGWGALIAAAAAAIGNNTQGHNDTINAEAVANTPGQKVVTLQSGLPGVQVGNIVLGGGTDRSKGSGQYFLNKNGQNYWLGPDAADALRTYTTDVAPSMNYVPDDNWIATDPLAQQLRGIYERSGGEQDFGVDFKTWLQQTSYVNTNITGNVWGS